MHLHTLWRQTEKNSCDSTLAFTLWHQNPKKSTIGFTFWRQSKKTHRIYQHLHSFSGANLCKTHRNQHMHSPSGPQTPRNHQHLQFTLWRQSNKHPKKLYTCICFSGAKTQRNHQHFHPPSGAKTPTKFINDCTHQPNKLHSYIAHTHTQILWCIT